MQFNKNYTNYIYGILTQEFILKKSEKIYNSPLSLFYTIFEQVSFKFYDKLHFIITVKNTINK